MKTFDLNSLPKSGWKKYRKRTLTEAQYINEGFIVHTAEGTVELPDGGWLAVDSRGYPYPIAVDEFNSIYEEVR